MVSFSGDLPAIPSPESWPKVNDAALNICVPTPSTVRPSNWRLIVDIFRRGISVGEKRDGIGPYDVVIPDLGSLPDFGRFLKNGGLRPIGECQTHVRRAGDSGSVDQATDRFARN